MQLNRLRRDLRFNKELLSLVETLKNVAGSQYHLMEREKERFDRFMHAFAGFFRVINLVDVVNPLVRQASETTGVVIVTSDSGFMGGLNQSVIRSGLEAASPFMPGKVAFVVVGEKGSGLVNDMKIPFKFFQGIAQDTILDQAGVIRDYLVGEVLAGRMGRVLVARPRALSFSAQTIDVIQLLPCGDLFDKDAESEVSRLLGRTRLVSDARRVIVESSFDGIVSYLASVWVTAKLYEVFEDSKLAEFSARAMHLEGSCQKVEKQHKKLRQITFKASHERIDKGMRESFAATKANKKKQ